MCETQLTNLLTVLFLHCLNIKYYIKHIPNVMQLVLFHIDKIKKKKIKQHRQVIMKGSCKANVLVLPCLPYMSVKSMAIM